MTQILFQAAFRVRPQLVHMQLLKLEIKSLNPLYRDMRFNRTTQ